MIGSLRHSPQHLAHDEKHGVAEADRVAHHACAVCGHSIEEIIAGFAVRAICTNCGLENLIPRDAAQRRRDTDFAAPRMPGDRADPRFLNVSSRAVRAALGSKAC